MADWFSPTAVANQALDASLLKMSIGDIEEGTEAANVCLRAYTTCFEQLLRGAHWDFARKEAPMMLHADASGQTTFGGVVRNLVPAGFIYSYGYPLDCAKVRFVPANYWNVVPPVPSSNIMPPNESSPLTTGMGQPPWVGQKLVPSRFLITSDMNYIDPGAGNQQRGVSPIGQTVICSNVQEARLVYTFRATYPNLWDELFRSAMVAYLASEIVLRLTKNEKLGLVARKEQMAIAQMKITQARATNGNESWANADIAVDWIRVRNAGGWQSDWGWTGPGAGCTFGGYDGVMFSGNTAAY